MNGTRPPSHDSSGDALLEQALDAWRATPDPEVSGAVLARLQARVREDMSLAPDRRPPLPLLEPLEPVAPPELPAQPGGADNLKGESTASLLRARARSVWASPPPTPRQIPAARALLSAVRRRPAFLLLGLLLVSVGVLQRLAPTGEESLRARGTMPAPHLELSLQVRVESAEGQVLPPPPEGRPIQLLPGQALQFRFEARGGRNLTLLERGPTGLVQAIFSAERSDATPSSLRILDAAGREQRYEPDGLPGPHVYLAVLSDAPLLEAGYTALMEHWHLAGATHRTADGKTLAGVPVEVLPRGPTDAGPLPHDR